MSYPTLTDYKSASAIMNTIKEHGGVLSSYDRTYDVVSQAVDQALLFQEAWGTDLSDVQVMLGDLHKFLLEMASCDAEKFPEFRTEVGGYLNQIDRQLQNIENIEYSPTETPP